MIKKVTQKKRIEFDELNNLIHPGDRIFISSGPATPVRTVEFLLNSNHSNHSDLELIQLEVLDHSIPFSKSFHQKFRFKTFTVSENISRAFQEGNVDFVPTTMAELPYLLVSGAIGIDVVIVQTTLPDRRGYLNLGLVNDITQEAIKSAPLVIAEINPNMPVTRGATALHISNVNYILESSLPLIEYAVAPFDETLGRIGWHTANLIENGSTVSMGAGRIFNAVAASLKNKKDLTIMSHVISDWVIDLVKSGSLKKKKFFYRRSPVVTASCIGSKKLYDFVNKNSSFKFVQLLHSRYQKLLPRIRKLVSILNVNKIDISCDSVLIPRSEYQVSGFDGKLNFSIAATHSRGGKSIVVLRSTDKKGNSNIVIKLHDDPRYIR